MTFVEAKLHDESTMIQKCFDDNNDDDKKLKRIKEHPSQENLEQVKEFKNQEEFKISRIKIQGSRSQESRSRFKTQDSRMKRRLNQHKY